jgi:hypothetical protein
MQIRRSLLAMCGGVILTLAMSVGGHAAASKTYLTFSSPVALPGVTLGTGTYVFERVGVAQDIVRVTNKDNHIVYLTAFTTEVTRPASMTLDTSVVFGESRSGSPRRLNVWFPENERSGRQFIYR